MKKRLQQQQPMVVLVQYCGTLRNQCVGGGRWEEKRDIIERRQRMKLKCRVGWYNATE